MIALYVVMSLWILALLFGVFMLIRNHFVYENHMKVINAIHEYNQEQSFENYVAPMPGWGKE